MAFDLVYVLMWFDMEKRRFFYGPFMNQVAPFNIGCFAVLNSREHLIL